MLVDLNERELLAILPLLEDIANNQQKKFEEAKASLLNEANPVSLTERVKQFEDEIMVLNQLDFLIEKLEEALNNLLGPELTADLNLEEEEDPSALNPIKKSYHGKN